VARSNNFGASPSGRRADRTVHVDVLPDDSPAVHIAAGEPTEIVYTPVVDRAAFDRTVLSPGGTCTLTVDTAFAGAGCPIKVRFEDRRGRFETYRGRVMHPRVRVPVAVPLEAKEFVRADVMLDGAAESVASAGVVVLTEPVCVRDVRWSVARASRGEPVRVTAQVSASADGYPATVRVRLQDPTGDGAHEPIATLRIPVEDGGVEGMWRVTVPEEAGEDEIGNAVPVLLAEVEVLGVTARSWQGAGRASAGYAGRLRVGEEA
jgi:hypothetical protein